MLPTTNFEASRGQRSVDKVALGVPVLVATVVREQPQTLLYRERHPAGCGSGWHNRGPGETATETAVAVAVAVLV
jgi:hypothetical protein